MNATPRGTIASVTLSPVVEKDFKTKQFPTSIRMCYLRSTKDQNKVTTIGYKYLTPTKIAYHIAQVRREKQNLFMKEAEIKACKDVFCRKTGAAIVTGRFKKHEPYYLEALTKDELYSKLIYLHHPDKDARNEAKKFLLSDGTKFNETKNSNHK